MENTYRKALGRTLTGTGILIILFQVYFFLGFFNLIEVSFVEFIFQSRHPLLNFLLHSGFLMIGSAMVVSGILVARKILSKAKRFLQINLIGIFLIFLLAHLNLIVPMFFKNGYAQMYTLPPYHIVLNPILQVSMMLGFFLTLFNLQLAIIHFGYWRKDIDPTEKPKNDSLQDSESRLSHETETPLWAANTRFISHCREAKYTVDQMDSYFYEWLQAETAKNNHANS